MILDLIEGDELPDVDAVITRMREGRERRLRAEQQLEELLTGYQLVVSAENVRLEAV